MTRSNCATESSAEAFTGWQLLQRGDACRRWRGERPPDERRRLQSPDQQRIGRRQRVVGVSRAPADCHDAAHPGGIGAGVRRRQQAGAHRQQGSANLHCISRNMIKKPSTCRCKNVSNTCTLCFNIPKCSCGYRFLVVTCRSIYI